MLFMSLALLNPLCLKLINEHKSKMMVSRWKHINPFTSSIIFKIELEIKINMFCLQCNTWSASDVYEILV